MRSQIGRRLGANRRIDVAHSRKTVQKSFRWICKNHFIASGSAAFLGLALSLSSFMWTTTSPAQDSTVFTTPLNDTG